MKKLIFIFLIFTLLNGCGGSGSESNDTSSDDSNNDNTTNLASIILNISTVFAQEPNTDIIMKVIASLSKDGIFLQNQTLSITDDIASGTFDNLLP